MTLKLLSQRSLKATFLALLFTELCSPLPGLSCLTVLLSLKANLSLGSRGDRVTSDGAPPAPGFPSQSRVALRSPAFPGTGGLERIPLSLGYIQPFLHSWLFCYSNTLKALLYVKIFLSLNLSPAGTAIVSYPQDILTCPIPQQPPHPIPELASVPSTHPKQF